MDNRTSTNTTNTNEVLLSNSDYTRLVMLGVYSLEGWLMIIGGLILTASVCRHHALRKEKSYVLFMTQAFADMLNGFGYVYAAIYRAPLLLNG